VRSLAPITHGGIYRPASCDIAARGRSYRFGRERQTLITLRMRNCIVFAWLVLAACSNGDGKPIAKGPQFDPATPSPGSPRAVGDTSLEGITRHKPALVSLELDRKFVWATIDPTTGKQRVMELCGDDDMTAWKALPSKLVDRYSARFASLAPDDMRCTMDFDFIVCELAPRDEHETSLTFAISSGGPRAQAIAAVIERDTWMLDPESARAKTDVALRDKLLGKASRSECAISAMGRKSAEAHGQVL
jgi:hypothetical protein